MLSSRYVSCNMVFEKVFRDYPFKDRVDWVDGIEWLGEAIGLIGSNASFYNKVTGQDAITPTIKIEDYKGELPCDLYKVISARDYCTKTEMRYASDVFHMGKHKDRDQNFDASSDYTYQLNNNYIFCNFEEGEVELAYIAFPIDDKGYPMIPDDEKFIRACSDYVAERIAHKMYLGGEFDKNKYDLVVQDKCWSMAAAQTRSSMLSLDQMETLKNSILRTIPKINEHSNGFYYSGQQEQRYIYGWT